MLLQRVANGPVKGPTALTAREVLEIATLGGARVLNGGDIGALAPGMSADLVCVPLDDVGMGGAHDPLGPLFFCQVPRVKHTVVAGRIIVRDGQLTTIDLPVRLERHNRLARRLVADRPCRHRALGAGSYHHVARRCRRGARSRPAADARCTDVHPEKRRQPT